MRITLDWLQDYGACERGCNWFVNHFPDGGELDNIIHALKDRKVDWAKWLAEEFEWTGKIQGVNILDSHYELYYCNGRLSREDGPAYIWTDTYGNHSEEYWVDGNLHREDGPAVIIMKNNVIYREEYWVDGNRVEDKKHE